MRQSFTDWASTGSPAHVSVVGLAAVALALVGYAASERLIGAVEHVSVRRIDQPRQFGGNQQDRRRVVWAEFGDAADAVVRASGERTDRCFGGFGSAGDFGHCDNSGCVSLAHFVAGGAQ